VRICNKTAAERQTDIEALLPNPAAIGIVERSVYKHPLNDGEPRDSSKYKKQVAEFLWTFRTSSDAPTEISSRCGWRASIRSLSSSVTRS